jgi:transposase
MTGAKEFGLQDRTAPMIVWCSIWSVGCTRPVDGKEPAMKAIANIGMASMAQAELGFAPKAGVMVVFRSRRGDRVKVLFWDGSGIVMIYKRLEQGGFAWPKVGDGVMRLSRVQFEALFAGLDWRRIHAPRPSIPTATE